MYRIGFGGFGKNGAAVIGPPGGGMPGGGGGAIIGGGEIVIPKGGGETLPGGSPLPSRIRLWAEGEPKQLRALKRLYGPSALV